MASALSVGLTPAEGRKFGLTVGAAFVALAALMWWREHAVLMYSAGTIGILLVSAGLLVPGHLGGVQRAWMQLAHLLSRVTTPIVMALLYFVVLTPIGLTMRVFGRNPIVHRASPRGYWFARTPSRGKTGLLRQY